MFWRSRLSTRSPGGADSPGQPRPAWGHNQARCQTSRLHLSERLTGVRADLAGGVRVQDLVFDDKPQPPPVLFTAL